MRSDLWKSKSPGLNEVVSWLHRKIQGDTPLSELFSDCNSIPVLNGGLLRAFAPHLECSTFTVILFTPKSFPARVKVTFDCSKQVSALTEAQFSLIVIYSPDSLLLSYLHISVQHPSCFRSSVKRSKTHGTLRLSVPRATSITSSLKSMSAFRGTAIKRRTGESCMYPSGSYLIIQRPIVGLL